MLVLAYAATVFMGVLLGLLGGGGSLLTVPILVYMFEIEAVRATGYSLIIVGFSAMIGCVSYHRQGRINYPIGLKFGLPSVFSVIAVRSLVIPFLPKFIEILELKVSLDDIFMGFFVLFAATAAYFMIKKPKSVDPSIPVKPKGYLFWIVEGTLVGAIAGFVGAGGGFMIIPALVLLAGMDIAVAIPTSLFIIAMNSALGGVADYFKQGSPDWSLLGIILLLSGAGMLIGTFLAKRINTGVLKISFGWLMAVVSVLIVYKQWFA